MLRFSKSFAFRIFIIAFIILVIPLTIYAFITYRQEYWNKKQDLFVSMEILAKNKLMLLEKIDEEQKNFLRTITLPASPSSEESSLFLEKRAKEYGFEELYVEEEKSHSYIEEVDHELFLVSVQPRNQYYLAAKGKIEPFLDYPPFDLLFITPQKKFLSGEKIPFGEGKVRYEPLHHPKGTYLINGEYLALEEKTPFGVSLLVSFPEEYLFQDHIQSYTLRVAFLLFLFVGVGGGFVLLLSARFAKPLKRLIVTMNRLRKGDLQARFRKDFLGFEFNLLGDQLNHMVDDLLFHQREKEKVAEELKVGQEMQKKILSLSSIPKSFDVAPYYQPAKEVGGDYYDLFSFSETKHLISIADISGKGISACLFSLMLRSFIRSYARELDLQKAVEKANQLFCLDAGDSGMFATLWVGVYDEKTQELSYINGGHFPALLKKKNGEVISLGKGDLSIGLDEMATFRLEKIQLEKGDLLLLYTDGVVEVRNQEGSLLGKERLIHFLEKNKDKKVSKILENLQREVEAFSQEKEDDFTLLLVRFSS